jgi:hypothetical protein
MWIRRLSELGLIGGLFLTTCSAQAAPPPSPALETPDDPLAAYREQFKLGMDRYKAGALGEAVGYWEPIYRELGEHTGYRLAYDLGVAYQHLGDPAHAADRLEAFLTEVDTRRARGEALPPIVEKEESDARSRVATLLATKGRIRIEAGITPRSVRVDDDEPRLAGFVAWVTPGDHSVTFAAGTPDQETRTVHVNAGEIVQIAPSLPPTSAPLAVSPPPLRGPFITRRETHHPFAWPLLAIGGGLAVVSTVAAVPLEGHAQDLFDRYHGEAPIPQSDRDNFANARTLAYAAVAGAIGFAALSVGLASWYFLETSDRDIIITPVMGPEREGTSLRMIGRF